MRCSVETAHFILEDQESCIRGCEEFQYLGVKIGKEEREENYIKKIINTCRTITTMLWNKVKTRN